MYLIAGLGNPGKEYESTRHNVGFMAIDKIISQYNFSSGVSKFSSILHNGVIENKKVTLVKPMTYMNNSGNAIAQIIKYYKIDLVNILIIHDELDIPTAKIKIKIGGGSGGHNGIKSIDNHIGKDYKRIRIGIDHPGDKDMVSDYVLSNFSKGEKLLLNKVIDDLVAYIALLLENRDDIFLNKVNY